MLAQLFTRGDWRSVSQLVISEFPSTREECKSGQTRGTYETGTRAEEVAIATGFEPCIGAPFRGQSPRRFTLSARRRLHAKVVWNRNDETHTSLTGLREWLASLWKAALTRNDHHHLSHKTMPLIGARGNPI